MNTVQTIIDNAQESLWEVFISALEDDDLTHFDDNVFECADSAIPVYTAEILDCQNDVEYGFRLSTDEPALGLANGSNFDGENTVLNIVAANLYELVSQKLHEYFYNVIEPLIETYHDWTHDAFTCDHPHDVWTPAYSNSPYMRCLLCNHVAMPTHMHTDSPIEYDGETITRYPAWAESMMQLAQAGIQDDYFRPTSGQIIGIKMCAVLARYNALPKGFGLKES